MSTPLSPGTLIIQLDHSEATAAAHVDAVGFPDVESAAEAVARSVGQDVRHLVRAGHIDLPQALGMPLEIAPDSTVVAELLLADLERMLRMHLVSQVHLFLSDQDLDTHAEVEARYHALHEVHGNVARRGNADWSDIVHAPPRILANAHPILCVAWRGGLGYGRVRTVRPPEYAFIWTPQRRVFDTRELLRYRFDAVPQSPVLVARAEPISLLYREI